MKKNVIFKTVLGFSFTILVISSSFSQTYDRIKPGLFELIKESTKLPDGINPDDLEFAFYKISEYPKGTLSFKIKSSIETEEFEDMRYEYCDMLKIKTIFKNNKFTFEPLNVIKFMDARPIRKSNVGFGGCLFDEIKIENVVKYINTYSRIIKTEFVYNGPKNIQISAKGKFLNKQNLLVFSLKLFKYYRFKIEKKSGKIILTYKPEENILK